MWEGEVLNQSEGVGLVGLWDEGKGGGMEGSN